MEKKNSGSVVSVNISKEKGTVKTPVSEININEYGVSGDAHSGTWHRQVSLLSLKRIEEFSLEKGRKISPGEFAENITILGIDIENAAVLDRFMTGTVELEVTQIGKACHGSTCAIFREVGDCIMPKEGVFCRVKSGGKVRDGDKIEYIQKTLGILIITLSDRASQGIREDKSGPLVNEILKEFFKGKHWRTGYTSVVLPDDSQKLRKEIEMACENRIDVIITTGGTGIGSRDITPDVINSVIDKTIPGIMENIRVKYGEENPKALLSRSVAGIAGKTLVYALPGSVNAVKEYMEEILKTLEHCLYMVNDIDVHN